VQCPVIHIVKRFGRVGGMEGYVWHLVHGLVECGLQVSVVCEQVCECPDDRIQIIEVEASPKKPRWRSMQTFRARVDQKIRNVFSGQSVLIHSHERSLCHQVTTFHGPPIEPSKFLGWLSRFNKRLIVWRQMERDELLASNVQMVLPVSSLIKTQLVNRYPEVRNKMMVLAWPGAHRCELDLNVMEPRGLGHSRFLFVGKEWKRKGLLRAIDIVEKYRKTYPQASLDVYGVDLSAVPKALNGLPWVGFKGWSTRIPWTQYDVLVHPARIEPFGMVVAEARAHGVAALISDRVGAADLSFNCVGIVALDAPLQDWVDELFSLAAIANRLSDVKWTWDDLVDLHCQTIYPHIQPKSV